MKTRKLTIFKNVVYILALGLAVSSLGSCSLHSEADDTNDLLAYTVSGDTILARNTPIFLVERSENEWNRIATPTVSQQNHEPEIVLDSSIATIYTEARFWIGTNDHYTNLIYRIHFTQTPFRLIPFNLSAGKNVGLLVVITLNSRNEPVLLTTVHTCGCYLAFIPTSHLDRNLWPQNPQERYQRVYGERLPGYLSLDSDFAQTPLVIVLRDSTHRIKHVYLKHGETNLPEQQAQLVPMRNLSTLQGTGGPPTSFFETEGRRKDYVIDSQKFWERLLISWWALDWRVGEDKRLGENASDGIVFYTSLKPWAREESDMRDFARFLNYWGWQL